HQTLQERRQPDRRSGALAVRHQRDAPKRRRLRSRLMSERAMPRNVNRMTRAELISALQEVEKKLEGDTELRHLVEELTVHQEELQQQQGELTESRRALESSHERYAELFDFAPVGYVSLDWDGLVVEANVAACQLLHTNREALLQTPLVRWIAPRYRHLFVEQLPACAATASPWGWSSGRGRNRRGGVRPSRC